jgi:ankyrin repeat protein
VDGVRSALESGAKPGVQFRLALGEVTPIFLCAQKGYTDIAKVLLEHGASLRKRMDFDQTTCLHHAASNARSEMAAFLLSQKSEVDALDRLGRTPLMDGAEVGSIETVKVLLKYKADVLAKDKEGCSALSYCIDFVNKKEPQFYETAKLLVEQGADVNSRGKFADRTILHCAAAQGDFAFVKELVEERGADIAVFDTEGKSPAMYAAHNNFNEILEYLNARDNSGGGCCLVM